jgi:hypothetical protein
MKDDVIEALSILEEALSTAGSYVAVTSNIANFHQANRFSQEAIDAAYKSMRIIRKALYDNTQKG